MKLDIKGITSRFTKIFNKSSKGNSNQSEEVDENDNNAAPGINIKVEYDFHKIEYSELASRFNTSLKDGLTDAQAKESLAKNGKNVLSPPKRHLIRKLIGYMFTGFCGVLWIASIICFLAWRPIGDPPDNTNLGLAILLLVVIALQAAFSAFQDWSSNRVMKSIENLMPNTAEVIRNGTQQTIPASELVVGDLIFLNYGTKVPADIRIIETNDLKFDKAMLTGESEAVEATVECTDQNYVESKNIGFMTTLITNGNGKAIVILTGDKTLIGSISTMTTQVKAKKTPLQREITRFVIMICILAIISVTFLLIVWGAWLRNSYPSYISVSAMMVNVIGILVGFIPTGLPVAVTLSLLLMAKKMAKKRVLVKNLTVVETLSCVNVIASDKTGTLTQNKMFVGSAATGNKEQELKEFHSKPDEGCPINQLLATCVLCNNAKFDESELEVPINQRKANGDATDVAILRFGESNLEYDRLAFSYDTLVNIPFNSKNKWMMKCVEPKDADKHKVLFGPNASKAIAFLKGAPDILLKKCEFILNEAGEKIPLDDDTYNSIIDLQNDWCLAGRRVLILTKKELDEKEANFFRTSSASESEEAVRAAKDFCIVGLVGIIDPPRENITDVIAKCRGAGVRVMMVTGDYALTAAAIAHQVGIFTHLKYDTAESMKRNLRTRSVISSTMYDKPITSILLTGTDLVSFTDEDWRAAVKYDEIVLARTTPEQKLRAVKAFQEDGKIVAVTGDGVNDSPALKSANIGIAMGGGSEVAMDAAQMVLMDNTFDSILVAIENGRLVFDNLRKVIVYMLAAGSFAETIPMFVYILLGVPLPLSAFLMICISLINDLCPALSLMVERPEGDLLAKPPRKKTEHLVNAKLMGHAYFFIGAMETFFSHCLYFWYLQWYGGFTPSDLLLAFTKWSDGYKGYTQDELNEFGYKAQTVMFISLVEMQCLGHLFATRTRRYSLFQTFPLKKQSRNLFMFVGIAVALSTMLLIVYLPFINSIFNTRPVPAQFFFLPIVFAIIIITMDEIRKFLVRRKIFFHRTAW